MKNQPIKFGDESLSDAVIIVNDQEFHVHKLYLACRSEYFKAVFYGEFKDADVNRIQLNDINSEAFRRILELLYTGEISDAHHFLFTTTMPHNILYEFHNADIDYKVFWTSIRNLRWVANTFLVGNMFKNYLRQILSLDMCVADDCVACFNSAALALHKKFDFIIPQIKKLYCRDTFNVWSRHMKRDKVPLTLKLSVTWKKFEDQQKKAYPLIVYNQYP